VHDEGGVVLAGRCDEDMGVPYQPFVEALRHFVDHTSPSELKERLGRYAGELVRLVPDLSEQAPDLAQPLQSDPETERYRLFDAVTAWLSAASAEDALVLVLDDLQWAAKPTLLLLRHIVRAPDAKGLLILGTYRDTELTHDHALVELVADLRRNGALERLPLSGLDDLAVTAIVEQAAGHALDEDGVALARSIYRETEGNPFFVREVLRHLAETNAIEQEEGQWITRVPIEQLGIPEGIRDVVGRRLSRLSKEANNALRVAAVVGAEFDVDQLQAAGELAESRLLAALDEAVEARLASEVSPTRFRFSHALVRTTLYESLTGARKVALHRRVAKAIESLHGRALDDHLPALAHHWARASAPSADTAKAVDYAARAGDRALAQLAHDEAAAYYRQALELLKVAEGSPDDGRPVELLIALGDAQRRAGDPAHRETLLEATRLAANQSDADAQIRAVLANSRGYFPSTIGEVDGERVAALEAALAVGLDDTPTRARLLANLGLELTYTRDPERRLNLADEALAIARVGGDAATIAHVLLRRWFTIPYVSTLPERLANSAELIPLAEGLGDPVMTAQALLLRSRCLFEAGDIERADRALEAAARLADDLAQPTLRWQVGLVVTARTILAGDLEAGERQVQAGFELGQATGQGDAPTFLAGLLFMIRLEQGRLGELEALVAERVAAVPHLILLPAMLARLLCELDRPEEAREYYERVAANLTDLPVDVQWMHTVPHCAVVCAQLGDQPRARVLFDLLTGCASEIIFTAGGVQGARAHYLALLARTLGDLDEAQRRFAEAATTHERIGAPTWLAHTRLEWARMLLARRQPGDAERARELLGQALATARDLGLAKVERDAVALLQ
jgi:tetratricopeptide (TPR) repeat protein